MELALAEYRTARGALGLAIRKSRAKCWDELLSSLNTDPWEAPVQDRAHQTPPPVESLEPHI